MWRIARAAARLAVIALFAVIVLGGQAAAIEPDEVLKDPRLEARARAISSELRCPVCQNQSIDDSNAPLARDLRLLVRERLQAGDNDAAVKQFLVARYGEFVLLRPPFSLATLLLWSAPAAVLGLVGFMLWRNWRSVGAVETTDDAPLNDDEKARLKTLLTAAGAEPDKPATPSVR